MKWIKITEKLPEFDKKVLGYSDGADRIYICYRPYENEYNEHWCICDDVDCACVGCTAPIDYWMPLPEQPERSKREDLKLVYKEPDFEKMEMENPILYEKYLKAKEALRCGALNSMET